MLDKQMNPYGFAVGLKDAPCKVRTPVCCTASPQRCTRATLASTGFAPSSPSRQPSPSPRRSPCAAASLPSERRAASPPAGRARRAQPVIARHSSTHGATAPRINGPTNPHLHAHPHSHSHSHPTLNLTQTLTLTRPCSRSMRAASITSSAARFRVRVGVGVGVGVG